MSDRSPLDPGRAWGTSPPQGPRGRRRSPWALVVGVLTAVALLVVAGLVIGRSDGGGGGEVGGGGGSSATTTSAQPAGSTTTTANRASTTKASGRQPVMTSCAVTQGFITRECGIAVPPGLPEGTKLPVVVLLHGFSDGPGTVRDAGRWSDAVLTRRFMLVTPAGIAGSWNAGDCCGIAKATGIDDTSFLAGIIDTIAKRPDVDPARIYLAGFSNGGMMAYRFACVSDQIAAMASVSGTRVITCPPKKALPILHVHGTADDTVPYQGGQGLMAAIMGVSFPAVPATMDAVAAADGCSAPPSDTTTANVTVKEWDGCGNGARVEFVTLTGGGHTWPLGGSYNATDEVLSFFGIR